MQELDQAKIKELLGKYVIIGLTYIDSDDQVRESIQLHGRIRRVHPDDGIVIQREDKEETYTFPYDLAAFEAAEPGEYRLAKTGEVIHNPDYLSTWEIQKPKHHRL